MIEFHFLFVMHVKLNEYTKEYHIFVYIKSVLQFLEVM